MSAPLNWPNRLFVSILLKRGDSVPCELSGGRELKVPLSSVAVPQAELHAGARIRLEFQATDCTFIHYGVRNYYGIFEKRSNIKNMINTNTNFKKCNVPFLS